MLPFSNTGRLLKVMRSRLSGEIPGASRKYACLFSLLLFCSSQKKTAGKVMGLRHVLAAGALLALSLYTEGSVWGQSVNNPGPSAPGDWIVYPGSYNSQRHSPLNQVTPANAHQLQVRWVHHVSGSRELDKFHSFGRADLSSVTIKRGSIMPTDYDKRLSADEFRDLMAFLTRQGTKVASSSSGGGE